jgi:hypothetical protein
MSVLTRRCALLALALTLVFGAGLAFAFPAQTPGFQHSSLLQGVIVYPQDGGLRLINLMAVHLPDPPGGPYDARAADPARQLWAILSAADGAEIARLNFSVQKMAPTAWLLSYYTLTYPGQEPVSGTRTPKLAPGDYVLDFFVAGPKFYTFPFGVRQVGGKFLSIGPWNSWGYLFHADGDPEQQLIWKIWLRRHETGDRDGIATKIELVREKDGKLIATSRPLTKQYLNEDWVRHEFGLIHPMQGTGGGAFFKAGEMLAQDGKYVLKMSVDGAPYGVWRFEIAGHKPRLVGRADRQTADPLTYVHGGTDAFWYQSEAAVQADTAAMAPPERHFAQHGMIPDCQAVVVGGTTLVMVAPVVKFLEAQSEWNAGAKTLKITRGERTLTLIVGQTTATGNAGPVALGAAATVLEGSLYIPLRPVAEALGAEVTWDADKRLLTVIDGNRAGMIYVPK